MNRFIHHLWHNAAVPISYKYYAFTNQILSTIGNTNFHHYVIEIAEGGKTIIRLTTRGNYKLGNCYPSAIFTSYSNSILERFVLNLMACLFILIL